MGNSEVIFASMRMRMHPGGAPQLQYRKWLHLVTWVDHGQAGNARCGHEKGRTACGMQPMAMTPRQLAARHRQHEGQ